jgi:hypothetical protein
MLRIMATKRKNAAAAALVKRRWAKTTAAERKAVGRALAKARWERVKDGSAAQDGSYESLHKLVRSN